MKHSIKEIIGWFSGAEYIRQGIVLAALVVSTASLFLFFIKPYEKNLAELKEEMASVEARFQNYRSFEEKKPVIGELRLKISEMMEKFRVNLASSEAQNRNYLDEISAIASETGVKIDKISPSEKTWGVAFTAKYTNLVRFIARIEKNFKLQNLTVKSGENEPVNAVEMTIEAIAPNFGFPKPEGVDFFVTLNDVASDVSAIEEKDVDLDVSDVPPRDPMSFAETIFPQEKKPKIRVQKQAPRPPVKVDSIFWDPSTPVVVIDGRAWKEGEEINGVEIIKINEDDIKVKWRSKTYTLKK
ncbi:MAG: hypothetical protein JW803_00345 [Endomicrobiales bacterium]|nr:hypothetical protein [Endomicrobiales bacterium]